MRLPTLIVLCCLVWTNVRAQNALPNLRPPFAPRPSDPYWKFEWHLEQRDVDGVRTRADLNVRGAWELTKGEGIIVAIADDGVDLNHPDLVSNAVPGLHFDFELGLTNGFHRSPELSHGTHSIGLVAAALDGRGMAGIAPMAKFASWNIYPIDQIPGRSFVLSEKMAKVYEYQNETVAVQIHNWNEVKNRLRQIPPDALEWAGISNAVRFGRGGKGVVMVRPAGNAHLDPAQGTWFGRNANDNPFTADPRAIAVAAARADGRVASYSERGACILIAGLSGDSSFGFSNIFTADPAGADGANVISFPSDPRLSDYVFDSLGFSGTSAATPMVGGICALILSANPNLTSRDVQQVLIHSSRHIDRADPELRRNAAGYWVSHRVGFGIPDAGEAVRVAPAWQNRPATVRRVVTSDITAPIPIEDASLRVHAQAPLAIPALQQSYVAFPSYGIQPDAPTGYLPLVDVDLASAPIAQNLRGKGALIRRGGNSFVQKVDFAAAAGAAFAIIYNNVDFPALTRMGNSDFMPIPTVSIRRVDGEALAGFIAAEPSLRVEMRGTPAVANFNVTERLICEHVGVRIQTTHLARQDLRITLVSPRGSRSILQAFNFDENPGPEDWTYYSTQHFYEPSGGVWKLEITDQVEDLTGELTGAELIIHGIPIDDADGDGLDDNWEVANFGNLSQGILDDPDGDGAWNAREQALRTNPGQNQTPLALSVSALQSNFLRVAFPSAEGTNYVIGYTGDLNQSWQDIATIPGAFGETEIVTDRTGAQWFLKVRQP